LSLSVFVGAAPHGARVPDACCWLDAAEMRIAALPASCEKLKPRRRLISPLQACQRRGTGHDATSEAGMTKKRARSRKSS